MKKIILIINLLAIGILCIPSAKAEYVRAKTIPETVEYFANYYKIDKPILEKIIKCESGGNPNAINYNDGGKGKHSIGLLQFQQKTFETWEQKIGEDLNYDSPYDQIKLGSYMLSKGQGFQWTCFKIISK